MPKDDYPQLAEMGIQNPLQIDRYQVNGVSNYDILRVTFELGEGSFLPSTRTYKFPRVQKNAKVGENRDQIQAVMESHPDLRKALHELESLFATKDCTECMAEMVIEELQSLEEEVAMRSAYIKDLINRL